MPFWKLFGIRNQSWPQAGGLIGFVLVRNSRAIPVGVISVDRDGVRYDIGDCCIGGGVLRSVSRRHESVRACFLSLVSSVSHRSRDVIHIHWWENKDLQDKHGRSRPIYPEPERRANRARSIRLR